jgi:hypothetical protein
MTTPGEPEPTVPSAQVTVGRDLLERIAYHAERLGVQLARLDVIAERLRDLADPLAPTPDAATLRERVGELAWEIEDVLERTGWRVEGIEDLAEEGLPEDED